MYDQFYNFSEKPFNPNPDPKFLYLTPSRREALASMIYGINERKGFISITGEVGTGKTTLIYTLLNNLNEKVKPVIIQHTMITFEQLLKSILLKLGVPLDDEDKTSLLHKLNEYLVQGLSQEETLAIIIDEAQNLPIDTMEELRMLSNLETSKLKLVQIVVVGQPELEVKLDSEELRQLKQRIGIRRQIIPLSKKESREYIEHRLSLVGSSSSRVFTSEAVSLICRYAMGIPRTINILCDNALLIGYSISQKKINVKIVKEVIDDMRVHMAEGFSPPLLSHLSLAPFKKAFASRSLPVYFFSIIFLLSIPLLLLTNKIFIKGNQSLRTAKVQSQEILPSPLLPETVVDYSLISPDVKPEAQKKPVQVKLPVAAKKSPTTVVFKEGDSLYSIALSTYRKADETIFDLILQANPDITDVRSIRTDEKITLPVITTESYIRKSPDGNYQLYIGTFETFELATACSDKAIYFEKKSIIEPHKFSSKDTWHRVVIGDFRSKDEALKMASLLEEQDIIYVSQKMQDTEYRI